MKRNSFLGGALISTIGIILVKILGVIYVIPFNALIGEKGGALYGYSYNIYAIFLSMSSAGFPFAVSKLTSEYLALGNKKEVSKVYKISKSIIFLLSFVMFILLFTLAEPIAKTIAVSGTGGNTVADIVYVLRLVSFAILIVPFLSVTRGFLQGHKIITPGSISQVIEQLVRVVVIIGGCYLALNVFHIGLTRAVGISVLAASIGGLVSLLYLQIKLHKSNLLEKKVTVKKDANTKKIIKRLFFYAIPYVVISLISNLYEVTDMIIVQKVMSDVLHASATLTESVSSVFTVWGGKFNGIILALIMGLNMSLTPNLVESFTKGDIKDVTSKINKSLELILFIIVPLTLFISAFSGPLWTMFYGKSFLGTDIYNYFVFYALFGGIFTVIVNILQSLSKYKEVIVSILIGLVFNLIFDAPFIILWDKLGLVAADGAVVCGLIGYTLSITYSLVCLNKRYKISFNELFATLKEFIIPWVTFFIILLLTVNIVPTNLSNRLIQIPILAGSGIVCFSIYLLVCYRTGILKKIISDDKSSKNGNAKLNPKALAKKLLKKKLSKINYDNEDSEKYSKALKELVENKPELKNEKITMIKNNSNKSFDPYVEKVLYGYDLVNFELNKYGDDEVENAYHETLCSGDAIKYKAFPPCVNNMMLTSLSSNLNVYPSTVGSSRARQDLVDYLVREGFPSEKNEYCDAINVHNVAFCGSTTQAFYMLLKTIARPGDVMIVPTPTYGIFAAIAENQGVHIETIPLRYENDYLIDPKELNTKIISINKKLKNNKEYDYTPKVVLYLNVNPHNPIGNVMSENDIELIKELSDVCLENGVFIVDDLIYRDLCYDRKKLAYPIASIPKYFNNTISLFGISKSYGLASLRAGFIVMPTPIFWGFATQVFDFMDSMCVTQVNAVRGAFNGSNKRYKDYDRYFNKLIPEYLYRLDLVNVLINGIDVITDKKTKRKIIRDIENYSSNKEVSNKLLKGIDGVKISDKTFPKSGFFVIVDFTSFKGKYYKGKQLKTEYDLLKAMYNSGKVKYLMGENFMWSNEEEFVARVNFSISKNALIHNFYQISKLAEVLKDE